MKNGFQLWFFVIVISSATALFSGSLSRFIYKSEKVNKRGFQVEVEDAAPTAGGAGGGNEIELGMLLADANATEGANIFKAKCALCHNINKGEPNKVGPNLWNAFGSQPAQKTDFSYSSAMQNNKNQWNFVTMFIYLHKPAKAVPGTKMSFAGISDPKDLAKIVKYLSTMTENAVKDPAKDAKISMP